MINSFKTLFEARERKFQQERLFRGESVDLVAKITTDGVMDTLSSYSISGVYQPTDDLSGPFYPMDAEIVDGEAILHWTNDNDFGRNAYNVWGLLTKDGKAAYPICWRLMFAHSPSYPLSSVDPIPRTIDFSQYELLNAPWVELSALDEIEEQVVLSALQAVDGRYLPLSGSVMEEDATIGFPVSEDARIKVGKDGFQLMDLTTVETEAMSGWCWWSIPDPVPDYEIQWYTESEIANWSEEHPSEVPPWQNPRLRLCATKPASTETTETEKAKFQIPTDEEGDKTLATREYVQSEISDFVTEDELSAALSSIEVEGDYLPLSGGTVTGRIYFETNSGLTTIVGEGSGNAHVEVWGEDLPYTLTAWLMDENHPTPQFTISMPSQFGTKTKDFTVTQSGDSTIYSWSASSSPAVFDFNDFCGSFQITVTGTTVTATGDFIIGAGTEETHFYPIINWTTQASTLDPFVLSSELPVLPDDLVHEDELTAYAQLSDVPEVPTDLSAFTNSPGYLTAHQSLSDYYTKTQTDEKLTAYAQLSDLENIDVGEMSACLSSEEFSAIEELANDGSASLSSIIDKLDEVIRALKRVQPEPPTPPVRKTRVVYTDDSEVELDIQGTLAAADIPNVDNVKELHIGSEVTAVAPSAFNEKSNLTALTIGENVSSIGDDAFRKADLRSIHVPGNVKTIGNRAFSNNGKVYEIILDEGILSVGEWQFNNTGNNSNISSIIIPDSVTDLGASVFQGTMKVKSIHIGNGVTDIKNGMFRDASALTSITFGNALSSISGSYVFWGTSSMNNKIVTLPETITYIGQNAFYNTNIYYAFEGKTRTEVQAMQNFRWGASGNHLSCTDGTL